MRILRRMGLYLAAALALILVTPAGALTAQQAQVEGEAEYLAISRLTPPDITTPITKEEAVALDTVAATEPIEMSSMDDPGGGYVLVGNNKYNDWLYTSDPRYNELLRCENGVCHDISTVKVWFRQNVIGGSSRQWRFLFFKERYSGTIGQDASYTLNCYVNIKGEPDKKCVTWRDDGASGQVGPYGYYGSGKDAEAQITYFGRTNGTKKYPVVRLTTDWWGYAPSHGRFRGWDTCTHSTDNRLCAATGTGY